MDSPNELAERRTKAAELSGGISADPVYNMVLAKLSDLNLSGDILDYGAGTGELTRRILATRRFRSVHSADIMPAPSGLELNWTAQDLNKDLELPPESFDVVVSAEVIEHLENPRGMVRDLYRVLKKGGTAIITTPNNESWRALIALVFRGHYVQFGSGSYPAHITALLRLDLRRIMSEAGFTDISFAFSDHGGVPGAPNLTWQKISGGILRGVRFTDTMLVTGTKPAPR